MSRAAGDTPTYRFDLLNKFTGEHEDIHIDLISSTSVIKAVMGGSFGPAAWWGYRVGAAAILESVDIRSPEVDELYEQMKATKIHPNSVRDAGGERGNTAHDQLEQVARGNAEYALNDGEPHAYVPSDGPAIKLKEHSLAGACWWLDQIHMRLEDIHPEKRLYSLVHGFGGTADLVRPCEGALAEIVDYKTHKPALVKAPAYPEDLAQLASYRLALSEMTGMPVEQIRQRVVILRENGKYLEDTREMNPSVFLALLDIYWAMEGAKA